MPSDPTVTIEGEKEEDEEEKEEEEAAEEEGDTVIISEEEEGDTVIIGDEEDDPEQVAAKVIASLPHSPQKGVASSASASRIVSTVATSIAQSLPITSQLQTPIVTSSTELQSMQSVASTEQQVISSVTEITTSPAACIAIEEDIDLDKEIVIPQIDLNTTSIDEMRLISQMLEQKAKQKQLRSERDREFNIINGAKTILTDALGIKVDPSQHILLQLEEAVNRFNEDSSGEEKLIE
ncbi:hypothetical protein SUGI_0783320 [Cryptomeria japonica]|nr:hypothetical protein SUGI_0783320 [Cryptomeria japonica]